jgi:hypothetical protein
VLVAGAPAATAARSVPDALFGQHVSALASATPATLPSVGAIRLWDTGVTWKDLEPTADDYDWAPLQAAVSRAKALGATEILYTVGSTPSWAATNPNSTKALYGAGTNSPPRDNDDYVDFVGDLLEAAPDITAVQIWNEANLPDFYLGTAAQMAAMTKAAAPTIRAHGAKVVGASTTVRSKGPVGTFGKAYGPAMRKAKAWSSVDVVAAHFYPPAKDGPSTRVAYIKKVKAYYRKYGAGSKPLWDTEMNYGDLRSYMKVQRSYTGATAATYVARTYLDSMRYGVQRVFWYGWDINVLGTAMTSSGAITSGGTAFLEIREWMRGKQWRGCTMKASITTCRLVATDGTKQAIRWAQGSKSYKVGSGVTISYLDNTQASGGTTITLTSQPVLFSPA